MIITYSQFCAGTKWLIPLNISVASTFEIFGSFKQLYLSLINFETLSPHVILRAFYEDN